MKTKLKKVQNTPDSNKTDFDILEYIQPQGGISFHPLDYVVTGTGKEACIYVYAFPQYIDEHWLSDVCYFEGAITTIDISTANREAALSNINKSLQEQYGRVATDSKQTGVKDAAAAYNDLSEIYDEIKRMKKVLKMITIRIYIKGKTLTDLEDKKKSVLVNLDTYKGAVMLNEQYSEWKAMYQSYTVQQKQENARIGQPMIDEALAAGDPFHFSCLSDPNGLYLGSTSCGGTVNFNLFYRNSVRKYYNALIVGDMGSGKSTLLKKLGEHSYILGDFVRLFDVTGELEHMSEVYGWKRINLDGTDGIFNMFQILKVDEDEGICYNRHIAKLDVIMKILSKNSDDQEINTFNQCVRDMYLDLDIVPEVIKENTKITDKQPQEYPTVTTFIKYIDQKIKTMTSQKAVSASEESIIINEVNLLNNIRKTFIDVRDQYGRMLDGFTTIENIMDIQGVVFNIKNIAALPEKIANTILYETLSMCWDNCTRNGMEMKKLYETGQISEEDIVHFLIEFDEAHKVINARFPVAVQQFTDMQREMRKVFGGLILATQNITDIIPENSNDENIQKIRDLFSFSNYRFIGFQDQALKPAMKKAFESSLTETEYERISKLERGNFILSIKGDRNIQFKVFASDEELEVFRGGA
jgi:hypothetical protein